MKLPTAIRDEFVRHGRAGGLARAAGMPPGRRRAVAQRAASLRWVQKRFGSKSFEALGLPGGDLIDAGLADLANDKITLESLLVSLAAPRLRREGIPVSTVNDEPEDRLFALLSKTSGELAHTRYQALLLQAASFANACRAARIDRA